MDTKHRTTSLQQESYLLILVDSNFLLQEIEMNILIQQSLRFVLLT